MVDVDTFLTTLYVMVDDCCTTILPPGPHPGPQALRSRRERVTVGLLGQWQGCGSERGFSRSAPRRLRPAFPPLPSRAQDTRQLRQQQDALVALGRHLVQCLAAQRCPYAALASAGIPPREAQRRGAGWVPGLADIGWSNRLGWYAGGPLRLAVHPVGGITGLGLGAARPTAHPLADTFFAWRCRPHPALPSVGAPAMGPYGVDKGCAGQTNHTGWWPTYGAQVLCPPKRQSQTPWPKSRRRWRVGVRQIVETVYEQLLHTLRLDRGRPHDLSGVRGWLAAKIAWHNCCIWMNEPLGRPRLACTDLVDW